MSEQDNHTAIYEECKNLNTLLNDGKPHGLEECASMMPSMLELIMKHAEKKETMNRLIIHTRHPEAVHAILLSEGLVERHNMPTHATKIMDINYPDDAISQCLHYWLVMACGCQLIGKYEFRSERIKREQ